MMYGKSFLDFQVVAEKQMMKHLQKEVARLEAELRYDSPSLKTLLVEKEQKIQQVELGGTFWWSIYIYIFDNQKLQMVFFSSKKMS